MCAESISTAALALCQIELMCSRQSLREDAQAETERNSVWARMIRNDSCDWSWIESTSDGDVELSQIGRSEDKSIKREQLKACREHVTHHTGPMLNSAPRCGNNGQFRVSGSLYLLTSIVTHF